MDVVETRQLQLVIDALRTSRICHSVLDKHGLLYDIDGEWLMGEFEYGVSIEALGIFQQRVDTHLAPKIEREDTLTVILEKVAQFMAENVQPKLPASLTMYEVTFYTNGTPLVLKEYFLPASAQVTLLGLKKI